MAAESDFFLGPAQGCLQPVAWQPMTSARRLEVGLVGKIQIWHVAPTSIGRGTVAAW
jgi:hypothetical protein